MESLATPPRRRPKPAFAAPGVSVHLFNVGDFPIDLAEVYAPADARKYIGRGSLKAWFPSNSMLIVAPGARVVVDPGDSAKLGASMDPRPDPGRFRPVPLVPQLAAAGVGADGVTHVVVTHLHYDHFAGVTKREGGAWVPAFPNARHVIPAADWEMADIAEARRKGDEDVASTLGVIEKAGLVDFAKGGVNLARGVALEPYPGETPGHQTVTVSSGGARCRCIGDLVHAVQEVEHPELVAVWTDRKTLLASKAKLFARASKERALVLSGHMPPGRVSLDGGSPKWKPA